MLTTYVINKGRHKSTWMPRLHFGAKKMTGVFKFNESAIYDISGENRYDVNKLFGFTYGIDPHYTSFRIGWRRQPNSNYRIEYFLYAYVKGRRYIQKICTSRIDMWNSATISIRKHGVTVEISDPNKRNRLTHTFSNRLKPKCGFLLYPYFGGNEPAPQDVKLNLDFYVK